jgi:hypothetical protein
MGIYKFGITPSSVAAEAAMKDATFYDYDQIIKTSGIETFVLRANCRPMRQGFCRIEQCGKGWLRTTQWHSKHGRRAVFFNDLDEALTSGIGWARRREAEDVR